jgi:hypothetical protein
MADRPGSETWTDQEGAGSAQARPYDTLLDGRLLDPPEDIRPALRRIPSDVRFGGLSSAPAKEGHR